MKRGRAEVCPSVSFGLHFQGLSLLFSFFLFFWFFLFFPIPLSLSHLLFSHPLLFPFDSRHKHYCSCLLATATSLPLIVSRHYLLFTLSHFLSPTLILVPETRLVSSRLSLLHCSSSSSSSSSSSPPSSHHHHHDSTWIIIYRALHNCDAFQTPIRVPRVPPAIDLENLPSSYFRFFWSFIFRLPPAVPPRNRYI